MQQFHYSGNAIRYLYYFNGHGGNDCVTYHEVSDTDLTLNESKSVSIITSVKESHTVIIMSLFIYVFLFGLSLSLSLSLWFYRPLDLGCFCRFLILNTVDRTLWMGDQPVARPLPTHDNANRISAHRHPCLMWDSNPQSQRSSGRKRFIP
jgi:hypothetical protein